MDGKALAKKVKEEVRAAAARMERRPGLAVILVGDDPASQVYADGKKRDCAQCGIYSEEYILPAETGQEELMLLIETLNGRSDIDGILIQLPLPAHLNERAVLSVVRPDKDVDCFHPFNVGELMIGEKGFYPCTPASVMRLLAEYGVELSGKSCVIVGRSNIVGKPLAMLMLRENATVTICHTKTEYLKKECSRADILISAAGQAGLITGDMVKEGAVVVDVAVNRRADGTLCGDVVFEEAAGRASYITPVPGGVGPLTRAMLMKNTLYAAVIHGKEIRKRAERGSHLPPLRRCVPGQCGGGCHRIHCHTDHRDGWACRGGTAGGYDGRRRTEWRFGGGLKQKFGASRLHFGQSSGDGGLGCGSFCLGKRPKTA